MRTFRIDYTQENKLPDGDVVGKFGEHNATLLSITPPQEMTECDDIAYYRIAFGLTNYRAVHSGTLEKSENISLALFSQITRSDTISVQLIGYGADDSLVMKSETVKKLKFAESVDGIEIAFEGSTRNLGSEVAAIKNKLNKFGEDPDGNLIYNGKPISGSGERSTLTMDIPNGYFYLSPDTTGNAYWLVDISETFRENLEIKTISFLYNGEWVDIHEMYRLDGVPYALNVGKTFSLSGGEIILAVLSRLSMDNAIMTALNNFAIETIKVTYYTDGGAE